MTGGFFFELDRGISCIAVRWLTRLCLISVVALHASSDANSELIWPIVSHPSRLHLRALRARSAGNATECVGTHHQPIAVMLVLSVWPWGLLFATPTPGAVSFEAAFVSGVLFVCLSG